VGRESDQCVLTTRWVFPVTEIPLEHGTVAVQHGRIVSVDPPGTRTPDIDLGNAAIIPGLVNAHTHLDLTGLRGKIPPDNDFVGWLRKVIAHRRTASTEETTDDIHNGLQQALDTGTTLLGDISSGGASWNILTQAPLRAVCFRELLGLTPARVQQAWNELIAWSAQHPDTPTCRQAVSPHAPYSVHKAMIEAAARIWPICIHLAESPAEQLLLEEHDGAFVPFLQDLGVWYPDGLAPSWDWLVWRSSRAASVLFAHANYLPSSTPIPNNATIVYCPRTHAAFGFEPHPFRSFIQRGVRVALGTDSLASNPDLDVLNEARFVKMNYPDFSNSALLRMLTSNGAEALGFDHEVGTLTPGKWADLAVIPLADTTPKDPHDLLFVEELPEQPRRVMWNGRWRS
jgi:aminodeoxyfutalosine deaminase